MTVRGCHSPPGKSVVLSLRNLDLLLRYNSLPWSEDRRHPLDPSPSVPAPPHVRLSLRVCVAQGVWWWWWWWWRWCVCFCVRACICVCVQTAHEIAVDAAGRPVMQAPRAGIVGTRRAAAIVCFASVSSSTIALSAFARATVILCSLVI